MISEGVGDGHGSSGSIGFPGFRPISGDSCNECTNRQHEIHMASFPRFSHVFPGTAPCTAQESPQCESKLANISDFALS